MKKEITIGNLIVAVISILVPVITGWVTLNNRVTTNEGAIKALQEKQYSTGQAIDRIETKLDKLNETQTAILVRLETKKDKQ